MEQLICRTCLKTGLPNVRCMQIYNKTEDTKMAIKDMLEIFMPEMDMDIIEGEVVICLECIEALKHAYLFKNLCLKTEEKIYDYLHCYNVKLGRKINLSEIIEHNLIDASFNSLISEVSASQDLKLKSGQECVRNSSNELVNENNIDRNQSSSDHDESEDFHRRKKKRVSGALKNKQELKRSYTCDLCEYKAYRPDLLITHKQKHDKNLLHLKEYKCDFCMYSTLRKRALDRHLFTHKGKSAHFCEICSKSFAEKYQLKLHSLTHTGQELPHKCSECGKGFLTNSYLKQHMETNHLAIDKKFCQECPHEKYQHSFSRYYKCKLCESSFSDKRGLDAHTFIHTGEEFPYKCLHCSFSTAWKGNLKKHLQNRH